VVGIGSLAWVMALDRHGRQTPGFGACTITGTSHIWEYYSLIPRAYLPDRLWAGIGGEDEPSEQVRM